MAKVRQSQTTDNTSLQLIAGLENSLDDRTRSEHENTEPGENCVMNRANWHGRLGSNWEITCELLREAGTGYQGIFCHFMKKIEPVAEISNQSTKGMAVSDAAKIIAPACFLVR